MQILLCYSYDGHAWCGHLLPCFAWGNSLHTVVLQYCFHHGMVRLSRTSYNEMFCIFMRCLSCHKAVLSVVHTFNHTHKCCWISDHSRAMSVFSYYSSSNVKGQTKMLLNTQNGHFRQNVRKIFLKRSMLQVQDQVILWLQIALQCMMP